MRDSEFWKPNHALDRTAMSAVLGLFAESRAVAALMAVGQLYRWLREHFLPRR